MLGGPVEANTIIGCVSSNVSETAVLWAGTVIDAEGTCAKVTETEILWKY